MDKVRSTFIQEAQELLQDLDLALLALENNSHDKEAIEHVFRVMHTLKGNSKMFDFPVIADTVHELESLYDQIRSGKSSLSGELLNCSFAVLDHLKKVLLDPDLASRENQINHKKLRTRLELLETAPQGVNPEPTSSKGSLVTYHVAFRPDENFFQDGSNPLYLLKDLSELGKHLMIPHIRKVADLQSYQPATCHTYWDVFLETPATEQEINDVFLFAEFSAEISVTPLPYHEVLANRSFVSAISERKLDDSPITLEEIHQLAIASGLSSNIEKKVRQESDQDDPKSKKVSTVRVGSDKLEELMNLVSELITTQAGLSLLAEKTGMVELENISEVVEKLSRRLRDVSFGMTLVPIDTLFNRYQRMVRDISRELGKEVSLTSRGGETELDKNIIESLTDPIMHVIRNSIDHGIELPDVREQYDKARTGTITLSAYYSGVYVYIQISDDGRGIDKAKVRKKAVQLGIIEETDQLSEQEILNLIFHPGFSTADQVTDLSGRGVGMDVVHKSVTSLRGSISVASEKEKGTTLTIKLPLTLSVIDGLLIAVGEEQYVLPLAVVEKCFEVDNHLLINNFNELLVLDGQQYPFINLRAEFGHETDVKKRSEVIIVQFNELYVALAVDHIVGEYQAVVKPLGKHFQAQDFVSGATILGDGSIALILDSQKMVELYAARHRQYQI